MTYAILAAGVVILHIAFVLFVIGGGLWVWRAPKMAWLHIPAVLWGAYVELAGKICPLTPLENQFRALAGQAGYDGAFIDHYLRPLIYPDLWMAGGAPRGFFIGLGVAVIVINSAIYMALWLKARR